MVSVHTGLGVAGVVMRRTFLVATGVFIAFTVAACGGSDGSSDVKGTLWRWVALLEGQDAATGGFSAVPDLGDYLLTLREDGAFNAKADCNNLSGTYSLSGSDLTLEPGPMTKVACGDDSLSDKYVALLGQVRPRYTTRGNSRWGWRTRRASCTSAPVSLG
jgi:heat shock protein HslJ